MELTNATLRLASQLDKAHVRRDTGLFKAEGDKCVADTLGAFDLECLAATHAWTAAHPETAARAGSRLAVVSPREMARMSSLKTAPEVLALYRIPDMPPAVVEPGRLTLALDCVQDPGNVGTIVRTADWMGVDTVLASEGTADIWSPKVVMSTMGALARVRVCRCDLPDLLTGSPVPVFGMALDGEDLYRAELPGDGGAVLVMGNEGSGISDAVAATLTRKLLIPAFGPHAAESLNVAVATAVTLGEFRRRAYYS